MKHWTRILSESATKRELVARKDKTIWSDQGTSSLYSHRSLTQSKAVGRRFRVSGVFRAENYDWVQTFSKRNILNPSRTNQWWRWAFLVLGSCLARRTESPAGLQSVRTWRWEQVWRGWSVRSSELLWSGSPHCPPRHLMIKVIVEPQQTVPRPLHLHHQTSWFHFLLTGYQHPI